MQLNYYEILEVNRKASKDEIKAAFRKLAKKYHPDKIQDTLYEDFFKKLNEAYHTLIDDKKRYIYDSKFFDTPQENISYTRQPEKPQKRKYRTYTTSANQSFYASPFRARAVNTPYQKYTYVFLIAFFGFIMITGFVFTMYMNKLNSELKYEEALDYYHKKDYYLALKKINAAVSFNKKNVPAHLLAANIHYFVYNNYFFAVDEYSEVLKYKEYSNSQTYYRRAEAFKNLDKFEQAEADYKKAISLNAASDSSYYALGEIESLVKNNYKKSLFYFNKAVQINPEFMDAFVGKGYCEYYLKDYKRSVSSFNKALSLNAKLGNVYNLRGMSKLMLNDKEGACYDFGMARNFDVYVDPLMMRNACP